MRLGAILLSSMLLPALVLAQTSTGMVIRKDRADYLLHCGGCHGLEGVSNSVLVPDLKNQVGYFLNLKEGREYLVRLPNVAFSTDSDEDLAALVNFVVFQLGGDSVPAGVKPYTAKEVAALRREPLNEVSLLRVRQDLVDALIEHHNAAASLRRYGSDYSPSTE